MSSAPDTPLPSEPEKELSNNEQEHDSSSSQSDSQPKIDLTTTVPPAATATNDEEQWITGFKLLNIITATTLVCLLILMDISIVSTAIPRITNEFHSLDDIGWYGGAYLLASSSFLMLSGKFFVNFKSKWTFLVFFFVFEIGSLICGVATSSKMLIVGRAIAGVGSSGLFTGILTIIAACVPMHKRPMITGFVMGVGNLGLVMGPLIGGALTEYTTWRWCFYINLPIGGLVAAMLVFIHIPDQIPKDKAMAVARTLHTKLDLLGFVLFAATNIEILLALQYGGNQFPWNSSVIIGLFCGSGVTFIVFLFWEWRKGDSAMIPFSMARLRYVWSSCIVYAFWMGQLYCTSYYLPVYFQGVKGKTPLISGVYLLPSILAQLFSAIASGFFVGRLGYYLPFVVTGGVMISVANGLLSTFSPGTSTGKWIGYQIILGVGRGIGLQMPVIAVQNTLKPAQIPLAMALVMFSQSFGGAILLSLAEVIFTTSLRSLIPQYAPSIDPQSIINEGATGFRAYINADDLVNVLIAYAKSVDRVFYMTAASGVMCFAFGWAMGWKDIRKKKVVSKA